MKKILVCGAGGFIGHHLVKSLKKAGNYVIGVDLNFPEFESSSADEFIQIDLRNQQSVSRIITSDIDYIYQLAADMGGAGYIFTGDNDAKIMHNSAIINLNILDEMVKKGINNIFYSSSACVYPEYAQNSADCKKLAEVCAYPADPDSNYGLEKLFSERLYTSYHRNYGINISIARLHNVYGPLGAYNNGREKSPAALCRKIIESNGSIDVWGTGDQTRSYLYIDECIKGILKLSKINFSEPINLGSERRISINNLARLIANIENKEIKINNISGPTGVVGRASDNTLLEKVTRWRPDENLEYGITQTYYWIKNRINNLNES